MLGANDGLVSNLSLVMGVAGAELSSETILVTGIAGLLAGALSMAMGEWISVQSSRELYAHQIDVERLEIATMPELETEELALIYRAKGVASGEAHALAATLVAVAAVPERKTKGRTGTVAPSVNGTNEATAATAAEPPSSSGSIPSSSRAMASSAVSSSLMMRSARARASRGGTPLAR